VEGPVEVRWAWRYNELKPRVYFARGGKTYHHSKYIQPLFNIILDRFEEVHRRNRFFEPAPYLDNAETSVIYDYAAFTSSLEEIKRFIGALARFLSGTTVTLFDAREGYIQADLGILLLQYNTHCNEFSEFDAEGILGSPDYRQLFHSCGMLGVPGNISSCTLLHGIVLRFVGGIAKGKCVGDDAKVYTELGNDMEYGLDSLVRTLQCIGKLQASKFAVFPYRDTMAEADLDSYHFIKKPYTRVESRMLSGELMVLPNPAIVLEFSDKYHTIDVDEYDVKIKKFGKAVQRFARRMIRYPRHEVDYMEPMFRDFIGATLKMMTRLKGRSLWELKTYREPLILLRLPSMRLSDCSSWDLFIMKYDLDDDIIVPRPWATTQIGTGFVEWIYTSHPLLSYLVRTSYLRQKKQLDRIRRRDHDDLELKEWWYDVELEVFRTKYKNEYKYVVVDDPPDIFMKEFSFFTLYE